MRVSEVLHLKPEDVDDARDLLIIRNTKFRKSRLVPLHASVLTALNLYCDARARQVGNRKLEAFFVSDKAQRLRTAPFITILNNCAASFSGALVAAIPTRAFTTYATRLSVAPCCALIGKTNRSTA